MIMAKFQIKSNFMMLNFDSKLEYNNGILMKQMMKYDRKTLTFQC